MHGPTARILVMRHGETAWNVDARIQGHLDIPLNDMGRWQAENLAISLAREKIDAIYSSDLSRAFETATAVARLQGREVKIEPLLRERHFGIFQGRQFKDIEKEMPEQALRWRQRDPDFSPEGGESIRQFYARCVDTAARLSAAYPDQTVALVAHGGVLVPLQSCFENRTASATLVGNKKRKHQPFALFKPGLHPDGMGRHEPP